MTFFYEKKTMKSEDKNKSEDLNISELIKPYVSRWYWFFISVLLCVALSFWYLKHKAPTYKSQASVLIKDAKKMSSASGDFSVLSGIAGISGMGTNSIENELEIFKSKNIVSEVVKINNFQTTLYSKEPNYSAELYKSSAPYEIKVVNEKNGDDPKKPIDLLVKGNSVTLTSEDWSKPVKGELGRTISLPFANLIITKNNLFDKETVSDLKGLNKLYFTYSDLEDAVDNFQKKLFVDLADKDATVILLSADGQNKEKNQDFLNGLVVQYNRDAIEDKNTESFKTKQFIDDRISIISKELGDVESERQQFKISNDVIDIPTEARMNLQGSAEARAKGLQLDTQLELSHMLLSYLNKQGRTQALPANIGLENEGAAKNIELYNSLVLQRNRLLENATEENPLVIELDTQIAQMRGSVRSGLEKHISSLNLSRAKVNSEYGRFENKIAKVPTQEKLFRNIERQQQIKESLYLLLLQKREEAAISLAMSANKARVVDVAYTAKKPVSPKKMFVLLGALIFGSLLPFLIIYIRQLLNNKISSKHEIEKISDIPVISEIPRLKRGDDELIQMNDVSPMAEAFRILTTNLGFLVPRKEKDRIILVTSSTKGEGKTFISINMSLALASPKRRVLLIGSDIRNPQLQRYMTNSNALGLTEYLAGGVDNAQDIINVSPFSPHCDMILSGSIPPNPTTLLENGFYEKLLNEVKGIYDYIIIDSAPLMLVTDSFLISHFADATVYITRSEKTEKSFIEFANANAEANRIPNVNFVLNDVHKSNYGYGNKFGYGYHADKDLKLWQKIFNK